MTESLELQRFAPSDIPLLLDWVENTPAFLMQWAGPALIHPLDARQMEEHLQQLEAAGSLAFKAIDRGQNQIKGYVVLRDIDHIHGGARITGVLVNPHCRREGIGARLMQAILRLGFEELSLHRIDLGVFDFNSSAIRCYERVGFKKEGVLRETRKVGADYWNICMMSMLEDEWRGRSAPQSEPIEILPGNDKTKENRQSR